MGLLHRIPILATAEKHRPWPRVIVADDGWQAAIDLMVSGSASLLGLWGDKATVHMALLAEHFEEITVVSYDCQRGEYPSVSARHPPALRLERAIRDLFGLDAVGAADARPWLDHGVWDRRNPLAKFAATREAGPYRFLRSEGEGLHQIPVGPVHAGIIEPGHFRFTANGEHVVRLEPRLGYVHKGIEHLMAGATLDKAAQLACRTSGDSAVAYSIAFAQAAEAALEVEPTPRALYLRALMAEVERLANHFGDIGAICNDASFAIMHAQCAILRERTLRAAEFCFGHRLMMDAIVPGGVASDIATGGSAELDTLVNDIRRVFPRLIELYDNTASLQDRTVSTGFVHPTLVRQYAAGGYIGRASGRGFDARRTPGYAPYGALSFDVPMLEGGDVNARVWVRIREVEHSLSLVEQILDALPQGEIKTAVKSKAGEGVGLAEAFRGDVLVWLRLNAKGRVERCHLRDASWFQWPLLEAAVEGNIVADFPLCNKSFNCSYSGHDL